MKGRATPFWPNDSWKAAFPGHPASGRVSVPGPRFVRQDFPLRGSISTLPEGPSPRPRSADELLDFPQALRRGAVEIGLAATPAHGRTHLVGHVTSEASLLQPGKERL